jgi:hypothetical protein
MVCYIFVVNLPINDVVYTPSYQVNFILSQKNKKVNFIINIFFIKILIGLFNDSMGIVVLCI